MDILLDVPFVTQMKVGAHAGGDYFNDSTGCWYSAVCMIGYYRQPGPRLGVPEQYTKPAPVFNKDGDLTGDTQLTAEPMGARYDQLKTNEHLVSVDLPGDKKWTCGALCKILQEKGPCFVRRGFLNAQGVLTGGHAIVLVGSKESTKEVIYHCPTKGPNRVLGIDDFNKVFKWDDARAKEYSMMYLPPNL